MSVSGHALLAWFSARLRRKLLLAMAAAAVAAALILLLLFVLLYRAELERERGAASMQVNLLLQAALENAMLKRDVPGLQQVVTRMGEQAAIRGVMILNPAGEVRFAAEPARLGQRMPELVGRALARGTAMDELAQSADGIDVLRSINPVHNKPACAVCHGPVESHPVNGVLVVDYDASTLRDKARTSAAWMALAGAGVMLLLTAVGWRAIQRSVLDPLASLLGVSSKLGAGDMGARVPIKGRDEFAQLGVTFNRMADSLAEAMRASELQRRFLQQLVDGLPDGIRVIDSRYRVVLVNAAYRRQQGIGRGETVDVPCYASSHQRKQPCVPTMVVCPLSELRQAGDTLKCNHVHVRADGGNLPVEVHASMVELQHNGASDLCVVESIRDLSQVSEVSQQQRLSELGLLAAGIAHEIHNPLGSIRLAVQSLLREVDQQRSDPAEMAEYLRLVDDQIDKCIEVTRRLLLLSRHPDSRKALVDINEAVSDSVHLLAYDAGLRNISQQTVLDPARPRILADQAELRMVILNLLQNAHHAMPEGGEITITTRSIAPDSVQISVVDNGGGIVPETLPHIFDPFFSRRADGQAGTGLGLTICKSIVERYGGTIAVESRPGAGTTFTINLPREHGDQAR
jgi:signal transduction histidine kinase/HAMP domain-containing protein